MFLYCLRMINHRFIKFFYMKTKRYLLFVMLFALNCSRAQNYQIGFTASGVGSNVDSVKVKNLVQNTQLTLAGGDILHLLGTVGLQLPSENHSAFNVYPNPFSEKTLVDFVNIKEGNVRFELLDIAGKKIMELTRYMKAGTHMLELSVRAPGVYYFIADATACRTSVKLISMSEKSGKPQIVYMGQLLGDFSKPETKINKATIPMQYNDGETLLFTAYSGNTTTLSTLIPTQSQTLDFVLSSCSDIEGNSYATVVIGTQTWMAENLKTTQFNDGTSIPLVTGNTDWAALTTPAYCWPQNNLANKDIYGAFYNWFVVDTLSNGNKNPCPVGWHVPDSTEWRVLITLAGGETTGGCKLKATGNVDNLSGLWWSPNICATNETGFSGLPANQRSDVSGSFYPLGVNGLWWGTTDMGGTGDAAFDVFLNYNQLYVTGSGGLKKRGYSVRCLKN